MGAELTPLDAAKARWWSSQVQNEVTDHGVQLHGGYGYMNENRVARAWRDARVTKIWDPQHREGRGRRSHGPVIAKFLCSNNSWPRTERCVASHKEGGDGALFFHLRGRLSVGRRDGMAMISSAGAPKTSRRPQERSAGFARPSALWNCPDHSCSATRGLVDTAGISLAGKQ
jgi:hypothetical protein